MSKLFNRKLYIIILTIIFILILEESVLSAGLTNLNLDVNKTISAQPLIKLRQLADKLELLLYYNAQEKYIDIYSLTSEVKLNLKDKTFNGLPLEADQLLLVRDGRTYLSLKLTRRLLSALAIDDIDLITDLSVTKSEYDRPATIEAVISLYNITDTTLDLKYRSGQLYDLYLSSDGQQVWRWSEGKFFTMALIKKELAPGENMTYQVQIPISEEMKAGNYILTGEIKTSEPLSLIKRQIMLN